MRRRRGGSVTRRDQCSPDRHAAAAVKFNTTLFRLDRPGVLLPPVGQWFPGPPAVVFPGTVLPCLRPASPAPASPAPETVEALHEYGSTVYSPGTSMLEHADFA